MNDNVEVRSLAESLRRRMEAFVETGAVVRLQASFRGSRARRRIVSGVRRGFEKLCRELEDPYWKGGTDTSGATLMLMLHPIAGNKVCAFGVRRAAACFLWWLSRNDDNVWFMWSCVRFRGNAPIIFVLLRFPSQEKKRQRGRHCYCSNESRPRGRVRSWVLQAHNSEHWACLPCRKIGQPEPVPTVVTADAKQEKASTSTCISRKDSVESVSSPALVDVAGAVPTDFSSLVEGKSLSELAAELAWTRKLLRQRLQVRCLYFVCGCAVCESSDVFNAALSLADLFSLSDTCMYVHLFRVRLCVDTERAAERITRSRQPDSFGIPQLITRLSLGRNEIVGFYMMFIDFL